MAINYSSVAERIFNLLTGLGYSVKIYNTEGKLIIDPSEAERILVDDPNILLSLIHI